MISSDTPRQAGFAMGVQHARTGDPADVSDARCLPMERERDAAGTSYGNWWDSCQFHRGYDDGYDWAIGNPGRDIPTLDCDLRPGH